MAMHLWSFVFPLFVTRYLLLAQTIEPDNENKFSEFSDEMAKYIPKVQSCIDTKRFELETLKKNYKLCLFIIDVSLVITQMEDPFYFPTETDHHFPTFWQYHKDRCIKTAGIPQASFYNKHQTIPFPKDILFICIPYNINATTTLRDLTSFMLLNYIMYLEHDPIVGSINEQAQIFRCIDGNNNHQLLPIGSRTCILAILQDRVVVGQPVFDPFDISEERGSDKTVIRSASNNFHKDTFLELQASYKGCAPQWGFNLFESNYSDGFIPDGHCSGVIGQGILDLLCCCYKKRAECAFSPQPHRGAKRFTSSKIDNKTKANERSQKYNQVSVTCLIGTFDERSNSKRRQGPSNMFLSRDSSNCAITFEYQIRPDLITYDLTYVLGRGTDELCHNTVEGKPFITNRAYFALQYNMQDKISITVCCNYTLCNNVGINLMPQQHLDMPATWTPRIHREIKFYCGYPPMDFLRYLSKDKTIVCPYAITNSHGERLTDGVSLDRYQDEMEAKKVFNDGTCFYVYVLGGGLFECHFSQPIALTYKPSDNWMIKNYAYIQRLMRQIMHAFPPMRQCLYTKENLMPLYDFIRSNVTLPRQMINKCFVYIFLDDFGNTMVMAGACSFMSPCCVNQGVATEKLSITNIKCKSGFCAQEKYWAVCYSYVTKLPDIANMIQFLNYADNVTDIVVARSSIPSFLHSDKIRIPYYCMYGVMSQCKEKAWDTLTDIRACITGAIDSFEGGKVQNGIRKTTVTLGSMENHTYYLMCALDKEGKTVKTLSGDYKPNN